MAPLVATILGGTAPPNLRLAAARGALPLDRPDLFRLLVALSADPDEEIRTQACATLADWPHEEMESMARDPSVDPAVLSFLVTHPETGGSLLALVLSNPATPVEALGEAARSLTAERLDTFLLNQTLLIRHPDLLDAVLANPAATALHRARVEEIRRHFLTPEKSAAPGATAPEAEPEPPSPTTATVESAPAPEPSAPEPAAETPHDAPEAPPKKEGAFERVLKLNPIEKIALAHKGSKEERSLLIRDANRSVQEAVINSPKISEREVEEIARMKNVSEEVLRRITMRRDWMRSYAIVLGLATNSKTPPGISTNLLPRLTRQDLKLITTDRNVPELVRRMARKNLEARTNKRGGGR
jgi:hypothetical protein